jgi:DNA-directed RNA polymerase specialized sigma24 family protein
MMKNALEFAIGFKGTKNSRTKLGSCLRAPVAAATPTSSHTIHIRTAGGRQLTAEVAPAGHVADDHPLDRDAWTRLLSFLEIIQPGPAGRAYERTRERLVRFFKTRSTTHAEELADATLDRVARKLARETIVDVRNPMGYVLGVARLIWLERIKSEVSQRNRHGHYEETRMIDAEDAHELERNTAILDRCLAEMPAEERALLLSYHQGRGQARIAHRQELVQNLGLNPGLLRTRVHRLRAQLGRRVDEMLSAHEQLAV